MSVWFILWFALSVVLLYFFGWTLFILYRQKKSWRAYAQKRKLRYRSENIVSAPEVSGVVDGYTMELFTGQHVSPDIRGTRKLTAFEILLPAQMPFSGALASEGMIEVVQGLNFKEQTAPEHKKWDTAYIAASDSNAAMEAYLTPARLDALTALMKVKNSWVIFIFKDEKVLLRFDTPDPLYRPKKIELLTKKMIEVAKVLELNEGEAVRLKEMEVRVPKKQAEVKIKADDLETGGLELEDDGDAPEGVTEVEGASKVRADVKSEVGDDPDGKLKAHDSSEAIVGDGGEKPSTKNS